MFNPNRAILETLEALIKVLPMETKLATVMLEHESNVVNVENFTNLLLGHVMTYEHDDYYNNEDGIHTRIIFSAKELFARYKTLFCTLEKDIQKKFNNITKPLFRLEYKDYYGYYTELATVGNQKSSPDDINKVLENIQKAKKWKICK